MLLIGMWIPIDSRQSSTLPGYSCLEQGRKLPISLFSSSLIFFLTDCVEVNTVVIFSHRILPRGLCSSAASHQEMSVCGGRENGSANVWHFLLLFRCMKGLLQVSTFLQFVTGLCDAFFLGAFHECVLRCTRVCWSKVICVFLQTTHFL